MAPANDAPDDPRLGATIGNYRLLSRLGEGGMGTVYLAENPRIGRRVAIKVLSPAVSHQPGMAERFHDEARAVTRIGHAGIVDIYDFGQTDAGELYYVMELLEGRELAALLAERGRLRPGEIVPLLEQICAALGAAHEKGVVHRDLKPENIFVLRGEPLRLKLLDFGVAKLLEAEGKSHHQTATGMILGTPFTIAPEQAAGDPTAIGPRTDLYSLGVVLYWLLAGRPPFCDVPTAVLLSKHILEAPPPLASVAPDVPPAVARVVERCLAKAPEERPASARAVYEAFRAAAESSGDAASPMGAQAYPPTMLGQLPATSATDAQLLGSAATLPGRPDGAPAASAPTAAAPLVAPAPTPIPHRREPEPTAAPARSGRGVIIVALLVAGLASGAGAFFWLHGREEPTKTAQPPVADAGVKRPRIELLHNTRSVVAVSSTVADTRFLPAHLVDGRLETAWNSRAGDLVAGWIAFRVPKTARVEAIELTVGFTAKNAKGDLFLRNHRLRKLEVFRGAKSLGTFDLDPALRMLQRITLPAGTAGGDFKLVVREVVPGTRSDWRELCVTELLVWGSLAAGEKPTPQQPAVFVGTLPGGSAALPTPTVEQSAATPLAERELSYTARLSPRDHQTPSGKPLRSAAMILQQDRANYHRFAQRDAEDEGDVVFGRRDARAWLGRIAAKQLSPAVARAIRSGTPKVRVTLRRGQLSVRVLSR